MLTSGAPVIQDTGSNIVEAMATAATIEEDESLIPGEMMIEHDGEQRDEAGLAESSKAIVAAMLGQDDPDGTDALALMMVGDGVD